jgi:hypothetical protein
MAIRKAMPAGMLSRQLWRPATRSLFPTCQATGTAAEVWRRWADDVRGVEIACGHLLPEQAPDAVLDALTPFLDATEFA